MKDDLEKYKDIINTKWPMESDRARMNLYQRAKIFLPFSALRGYDESLENQRQMNLEKFSEHHTADPDFFEENSFF